MDTEISRRDSEAVIRIRDRTTYKDHETFTALGRLFGDGVRQMEIDVAAVSFIDSAAIGMLLILNDEARRVGGSFRVTGVSGQVRRVFVATDLSKAVAWEGLPTDEARAP